VNPAEERIKIGDNYYLDLYREAIIKNGLAIKLSLPQYRLLYLLAQNLGQPVVNTDLISYAWRGEEYVDKNSLHVYISRIRKLIEKDSRHPRYLMSLRGLGYILFFIKSSQ
jgi:two-component system phosphate regulon response regulator OmpR